MVVNTHAGSTLTRGELRLHRVTIIGHKFIDDYSVITIIRVSISVNKNNHDRTKSSHDQTQDTERLDAEGSEVWDTWYNSFVSFKEGSLNC